MKSGFVEKLIGRLDRIDSGQTRKILARLLREKGFLEQVFESLREGVILLAPDGRVEFVNRAACGFFGLDAEQATGEELEKLVRGLDWRRLAETPGRSTSRDLEVFYPENRFLNFYLSPIRSEQTLSRKHSLEKNGIPKRSQQEAPGWVMLIGT